MRQITRRSGLVLVTLLLAACLPDVASTTTTRTPSTVAPTTASPSTVPPTTAGEPVTTSTSGDPNASLEDRCGEIEGQFTAGGAVGTGGSEDSDASVIQAYGWDPVGPCERIRVGFATAEGAPAVAPPSVDIAFLRWAGVIRLELGTGVTSAIVAEQLVDTTLVDRIYTVTQVDGTIFVDIHLREPAFVRAFTSSRPATVAVDIAAGGQPYTDPADRTGDLVIVPPDPATLAYPLTVSGYTLAAEESIEGVLASPDGTQVAAEAAVGANDFTWGAFSMVFPDGPPGDVTLAVGDGPELGLTLP